MASVAASAGGKVPRSVNTLRETGQVKKLAMAEPRHTAVAILLLAAYVLWQPTSSDDGSCEAGCAAEDRAPCSAAEAAALHLGEEHHRGNGWSLARSLSGTQWVKAYTRSREGALSLRLEGAVDSGAPEILSVLREVDLLPLWNRFCDGATLLRLLSPTQLWVGAGVKLPWPVPPQSLFVHASVGDDPQSPHGIVAMAQSPTSKLQPPSGVSLPSSLQRRVDLPVALASGRLRPLHDCGAASCRRTQLDIFLTFNLTRMAFLAGAASAPAWVVNMVTWIVVPSIWNSYLNALASIGAEGSLHAARIRVDDTRIYAQVAKRARQPLLDDGHVASAARSPTAGRRRLRWLPWWGRSR